MNKWNKVFLGLNMIPYTFVIPLFIFFFHASIILGRFPQYANPDPKVLTIYKAYGPIINFCLFFWFYTLIVVVLYIIFYLLKNYKQLNWKPIIYTAINFGLMVTIIKSSVFEWFID